MTAAAAFPRSLVGRSLILQTIRSCLRVESSGPFSFFWPLINSDGHSLTTLPLLFLVSTSHTDLSPRTFPPSLGCYPTTTTLQNSNSVQLRSNQRDTYQTSLRASSSRPSRWWSTLAATTTVLWWPRILGYTQRHTHAHTHTCIVPSARPRRRGGATNFQSVGQHLQLPAKPWSSPSARRFLFLRARPPTFPSPPVTVKCSQSLNLTVCHLISAQPQFDSQPGREIHDAI